MNATYLFRDCVDLLRQNGYAPASLGVDECPVGPFRVVQLPYPKAESAECAAALLCTVPAPRSEHDAVQNPRSIGLAIVSIKVDAKLASKMDRHIVENVGKAPVRVAPDGSRTYVFRYEDSPFRSMSDDKGKLSIESDGFVPLGSPNEWEGGKDPLNTRRSELPVMLSTEAAALFSALHEMIPLPAPPPPTEKDLERARVRAMLEETLPAGQPFRYDHVGAHYRLKDNGWLIAAVDWKNGSASKAKPGAVWNDPQYKGAGVAVMGRRLVTLWVKKIDNLHVRKAVEELIERQFPGAPVRTSSDGSTLRILRRVEGTMSTKPVDFLRTVWDSDGNYVSRAGCVNVQIREPEAIVIRGLDEGGREFGWPAGREPLVTPVDALPAYDYESGFALTEQLERLLRGGELGDKLASKVA